MPAILGLVALFMLAYVLGNYEMNIKSIDTPEDQFGITLGIIASVLMIVAVAWSGWRVFRTDGTLDGVMMETAKTTSLVFIILLGAAMLTSAFRAFGGEELVREFLNSLPGGFWTTVYYRDAGDLHPWLLPRLYRDCRGCRANRCAYLVG